MWQQHKRCPHCGFNPTEGSDAKCFCARSGDDGMGDVFGAAVMSGGVLPGSEL